MFPKNCLWQMGGRSLSCLKMFYKQMRRYTHRTGQKKVGDGGIPPSTPTLSYTTNPILRFCIISLITHILLWKSIYCETIYCETIYCETIYCSGNQFSHSGRARSVLHTPAASLSSLPPFLQTQLTLIEQHTLCDAMFQKQFLQSIFISLLPE